MNDKLLDLADRVEREEPSRELDADVFQKVGCPHDMAVETARIYAPHYTTSADAAKTLEPKDAQEIVARNFQDGTYVRITLKSGTPVYSDSNALDEPRGRVAAALRAIAATKGEWHE